MTIQSDIKKVFFWFFLAAFGLYAWAGFLIAFFSEVTDLVPGKKLYDDAYMFLRYAKLWLAGYGESWNAGEGPVYGNTSQLHFFVVLALRAFTSYSDRLVLSLSSAIPALLFLLYLPWVCAKHAAVYSGKPGWIRYAFWFLTASAAFAYFTSISMHFKTGMDACLSLLLHLLLIDCVLTYSKQPTRSRLILVAVVVYLAFLARPDNLMTCALFAFLGVMLLAKNYRSALVLCVVTGVLVLLDGFIKWQYFGDVVPLAFYVKQQGFYEGFNDVISNSPWFSFSHFLYGVWPFALLLCWYCRRENFLMLGVMLIPALLTIFYYFTLQTIMNLEARYFFPFTVYFVMAAVLVVRHDIRAIFSAKGIFIALLFSGLYVGIGLIHEHRWTVAGFFTSAPTTCDDSALNRGADLPKLPPVPVKDSYHGVSDMMKLMPAGVTVAMTEHGYMGAFHTHVNILDMIGLHNREVAHQGYSTDWFYAKKPDAIWIPHWSYTCINAKTFSDPRFLQEYDFYPVLFLTGYAVRKDSTYYQPLNEALETVWESLYPGLSLEDYRRKTSP